MAKSEVVDALQQLPMFAGVASGVMARLAPATRMISLQPHDVLFRTGDSLGEVHVVLTGTVKRAIRIDGAAERLLELAVGPHWLDLGEAFHGTKRSAFAEALSAASVIAIDVDAFRRGVTADPALSAHVIAALAARQCAVESDAFSHPSLPVPRRVLDYLVRLAGGELPLGGETKVMLQPTKQTVAARIGITPESLSRALNELSEAGLIVVERSAVHLQNAALAGLAGAEGARPEAWHGAGRPAPGADDRPPGIAPATLINACGRQRVWSQRMAIAWNLLGRRIAPAEARTVLRRTRAQFERNLARLDGLGLAGALGEALQGLHEQWDGFRPAVFDAAPSIERAANVFAQSESLLHAADQLTLCAERAHGTPEAHRVNVAGRNRMMAQRMTKHFLFCNWGIDAARARRSLDEARREFLANLAELRSASSGAPEVAAQLDEVEACWKRFSEEIVRLPAAATSARRVRPLLDASERLLRHVDTTVRLFERLAD